MAENKKTVFEQALTDAVLFRQQSTIEADKEPVEFSEDYRKAVGRLTKKTQRKTWKYVNTAAKRILIAAILIMLLATTAVAAIPALREGLIRFFMRDNGVFYSFSFTEEDYARAPREVEIYYAPSWVPPQYTLFSETYVSLKGERAYMNEDGYLFVFAQHVLWQTEESFDFPSGIGSVLTIDSESMEVETKIMQGYEVRILRKTIEQGIEEETYIWTDHNYFFDIEAVNLSDQEFEAVLSGMVQIEVP
ncbi:MAG: hypothetical protein IJK24_05525 [Oscillospiraceae bacterium]|jgi:hypothetical protein|nr:hypothetical protein [Oscillospiraceae bacterium]